MYQQTGDSQWLTRAQNWQAGIESQKNRTDTHAIGKADRRRAIPRFHQTAVILVERTLLFVHVLVIFPRLGNHHHHRMWEGTPTEDKELQAIVEFARVTPVFLHDGK